MRLHGSSKSGRPTPPPPPPPPPQSVHARRCRLGLCSSRHTCNTRRCSSRLARRQSPLPEATRATVGTVPRVTSVARMVALPPRPRRRPKARQEAGHQGSRRLASRDRHRLSPVLPVEDILANFVAHKGSSGAVAGRILDLRGSSNGVDLRSVPHRSTPLTALLSRRPVASLLRVGSPMPTRRLHLVRRSGAAHHLKANGAHRLEGR
mmetsp:Transcript_53361/g.119768  ORF Transcript_53361/g.119768 Transcript_53361/m.119768 type:complete len:207 (-) Transcript_53361:794-1414(-)